VEYASTNYNYMYEALNASYNFAATLKPEGLDRSRLLRHEARSLPTHARQAARARSAEHLRIPGFSERNLFDALYDTIGPRRNLKGASTSSCSRPGRDTFSKLNWTDPEEAKDDRRTSRIYAVSIGRALREMMEARMGTGGGPDHHRLACRPTPDDTSRT